MAYGHRFGRLCLAFEISECRLLCVIRLEFSRPCSGSGHLVGISSIRQVIRSWIECLCEIMFMSLERWSFIWKAFSWYLLFTLQKTCINQQPPLLIPKHSKMSCKSALEALDFFKIHKPYYPSNAYKRKVVRVPHSIGSLAFLKAIVQPSISQT